MCAWTHIAIDGGEILMGTTRHACIAKEIGKTYPYAGIAKETGETYPYFLLCLDFWKLSLNTHIFTIGVSAFYFARSYFFLFV